MAQPASTSTTRPVPAALLAAGSLFAQSGTSAPMPPTPGADARLAAIHDSQGRARMPGGVALSPDGALVTYTLTTREGTTLHLLDAAHPDPATERLIAPSGSTACSSEAPVWSPDSQTLAYTSTCTGTAEKPAQPQIFLWSRATGASRQLTHLTGIFQQAAWSPDGEALAFLFVQNATRSAGALAAMKPWSGVIGEDGLEVQQVWAVYPANDTAERRTPEGIHVYEFSWSPDSSSIAYIGAYPPGENNWWIARLLVIHDVRNGPAENQPGQVLFDPAQTSTPLKGLQIAVPRWSPDGQTIAFIGGLMSDQGSTGGDLWTIPATSTASHPAEPTDLTPSLDGTPTWFAFTGPHTLRFAEDRRGHSLLITLDTATRKPTASLDLGEANITGGPIKMAVSLSQTGASAGTAAFVRSGHALAPEVVLAQGSTVTPVTHLNDTLAPGPRVDSLEWQNEGFHVQGWLTYPRDYDPAKRYPLLVSVHGGPSSSASVFSGGSTWSELGYFVLAPNPRGSFGQGEAFTAANRRDFGYGDLRDILAGMDTVERTVSIDKTREGLMGWSYGGFMTMFAVTQTHRFRAAIAGAGIANWQSYYGENSIDQWMTPFFGATVYADPAIYAHSSAIGFIQNVTTPTLVVVGDRDGECPAPQSFEFWHALRAQGVKTQLVVYPNEGHRFADPAHIRDLEAREVAWFQNNMPAATPPPATH